EDDHGDDEEAGQPHRRAELSPHDGLSATVYPASSTAARTASSVSAEALVTVTAPVGRSTSTFSTPVSSESSSLTELTQWPQVMRATVQVWVVLMVFSSWVCGMDCDGRTAGRASRDAPRQVTTSPGGRWRRRPP